MDGAEAGDPVHTTTTTITVANTVEETSDDADLTITVVVNTVEEMADDGDPDHIHRLFMNGTDPVGHHIRQYSISEGKATDQDHLQDL